jgi:SAM-dependent methyltransferase
LTDERPQALIFGEVAELYDRSRPSYPDALVDDALAVAPDSPHVVDVGCGTGRAARLFAARGLTVTGIEPSAAMAAVARRACADLPSLTIIETRFEDWDARAASAGLVTCAQAWHWLDPAVRVVKAAELLVPGGVLAVFWNGPRPEATSLRPALDEVYKRWAPSLVETSVLMHPPMGDRWDDIAASELFESAEARTYDWTVRYTTAEYTGLMQTHSDHRLLAPDRLAALVDAVAVVIDGAGGSFEYAYRCGLHLARRRS